MQLKIYQTLNTILVGIILLLLIIFGFGFFYSDFGATENGRIILMVTLFIVNFFIIFGYRYLEKNWDRKLVLKMLEKNQVVLAKINQTDVVKLTRDTSGKKYLIHKMQVTVYLSDLSTESLAFYEKFNEECTEVPQGFVYITHNPLKKDQHFVVHNDLIAHFPNLQPLTQKYEKNIKNIDYLYSYQKAGLIIERVEDFLRKNSTEGEKI